MGDLDLKATKAFVAWANQKRVRLHGLQASELNGQIGIIMGSGEAGRLSVALDGDGVRKSVKPVNVAMLSVTCFIGDRIMVHTDDELDGKFGTVVGKGHLSNLL